MEELKLNIIDFFGTIAMMIMIYLDDIIDTIITIVTTFLVCLILFNYFFMPVQVEGNSMYPTLTNGEVGFANIFAKRIGSIDRFDIVVVELSERNEKLVKRVIGLPNETITYTSDCLYIDGKPVDEYFLDDEYILEQINEMNKSYFTNDFSYVLKEDEYFCLGDNRLHSSDSRYYGAFSSSQIVAKNIFVIWPLNNFGKAK